MREKVNAKYAFTSLPTSRKTVDTHHPKNIKHDDHHAVAILFHKKTNQS